MSRNDFIEVPEPLYKFRGDDRIHDDNKKVIEARRNDRRVVLSPPKVARLKRELWRITRRLKDERAAERVRQYEALEQQYNSARLELDKQSPPQQIDAIQRLERRLAEQRQALEPLRKLFKKRAAIQQRLEAHKTALDEDEKEQELLRLMTKEAELIAETCTRTLGGIGFKHVETRGDKTITRYVRFAECVTTPDQHQLKVATTRQGFAGGTTRLLPEGVRVVEILRPEVMRELSIALEREVWSPHVDEDVNNTNGAWIVVERLGLYEGIPKHVTYRQLMARYETAEHSRIPLPLGLKKGRRINWTYLDSHASTHIMFTGITGSGKTNTIQAALTALVEKQSPADVIYIIIDLKNQGDFNELAEAPHAVRMNDKGIIHDIDEVVTVLQQVRGEMHWRQKHIGQVAKNLAVYNRRVEPHHRLPRVVVLFDEYANTRRGRFSEQAAVIDDIATEITQIGRASGIHLWIGIQQPRASNMPPALRDNFTTLFVGHQANVGASQSVTGNRSSLKLPDLPGRMMAFLGWKSFEVQMPLIAEDDITHAIQQATEQWGDLEPYVFKGEVTADGPLPMSDHDVIIHQAMEHFGGALKGRAIWESLKPKYSLNEVYKIVAEIVEMQHIYYEGETYTPVKQSGNFYALAFTEVDTDENHAMNLPETVKV